MNLKSVVTLIIALMLLSGCGQKINEEQIVRLEKAGEVFEKNAESIEHFTKAASELSSTAYDVRILLEKFVQSEALIREKMEDNKNKISIQFWKAVDKKIIESGGVMRYFASTKESKRYFMDFVCGYLVDTSTTTEGRTPSIKFPGVSSQEAETETKTYKALRKKFKAFLMFISNNPESAMEFWEMLDGASFLEAGTEEQKMIIKGYLSRYVNLLEISQNKSFKELARTIIEKEVMYLDSDRSHPSIIDARKNLKEAYPGYTLFELQKVYRSCTRFYNAWKRLLHVVNQGIAK